MQATNDTADQREELCNLHHRLIRLKYFAVATADHELLADTEQLTHQVRRLMERYPGSHPET